MSFIIWLTRFAGWLFDLLRRRRGRDETRALARVAAEENVRAEVAAEITDRAPREMQQLARTATVTIGTSLDQRGETFSVLLRDDEVRRGGHWLVTGATGAGKSYFAFALLAQLLRTRQRGLVLIDMKGELAKLVRETLVPSLIATLPDEDALDLLRRVAVIAPFDPTATPPFQVLARDPELPIEIQAHEVVSSFGRTVGQDLGILQATMLKYAVLLAMDQGLTFPDVRDILQDDAMRKPLLERCTLPDVQSYFLDRFPKERGTSRASLLTRLDALLMHPTLRRMLKAPGMIRFDRLLEGAVTIIDLGNAPAGMRDLSRFFGQVIFQKIVRAIFSRRVTPETEPVTIVADEFQELLAPDLAQDFERILTLARSQRVFLWALFQQVAQVEAVSPTLLRIMKTNSLVQVVFRSSAEDARAFGHIMPAVGGAELDSEDFPDPRAPRRRTTAEDERRELVAQTPSLPDRVFWFWNRGRQYPALLVKAPFVAMDDLERAACALPDDVRTMATRGVLAMTAEEIDAADARRLSARTEATVSSAAETPVEQREAGDELADADPVSDTEGERRDARRDGNARRGIRRPRLG